MQQRNTRLLPAIGGLCSKLLKDVFTTIYTFRNGFTDTPLLLPVFNPAVAILATMLK
ncbi:hypothetical protein H0H93_014678, partial [Arthromyces matolae]